MFLKDKTTTPKRVISKYGMRKKEGIPLDSVQVKLLFTYLSCRDGPHKKVDESNDSIFPVL